MTKDEAKALWGKVVENSRALEACPGPHVFLDVTPEKNMGKRYRCSTCGGEADGIAVHWYSAGLKHASDPGAPASRSTLATLPEKP